MFQYCQPAAIVFTGIAGYTARMDNNQQKQFSLHHRNRAIQKPATELFNERPINEFLMVILNTVSKVMNAAVSNDEVLHRSGFIWENPVSIYISPYHRNKKY